MELSLIRKLGWTVSITQVSVGDKPVIFLAYILWLNTYLYFTAFLDMTSYYATAFKTGQYPQINEDKLYLWGRPHPKDANAPDPVGKPTNYELVRRKIFCLDPLICGARSKRLILLACDT